MRQMSVPGSSYLHTEQWGRLLKADYIAHNWLCSEASALGPKQRQWDGKMLLFGTASAWPCWERTLEEGVFKDKTGPGPGGSCAQE